MSLNIEMLLSELCFSFIFRYLYESSQCLKSCPIRTFKESTIEEECLSCPDNCLQCSNDGYKCEVCDVSHFRVAVGDGKCVKECPKGKLVCFIHHYSSIRTDFICLS